MSFFDRVKQAFPDVMLPLAVINPGDEIKRDCDDALWFTGKLVNDLTWDDWQSHWDSLSFFNCNAFLYYLPSAIKVSYQKTDDTLHPVDSFFYSIYNNANCVTIKYYEDRYLNSLSLDQWYIILEWAVALSRNEYYGSSFQDWTVVFEYIVKKIKFLSN